MRKSALATMLMASVFIPASAWAQAADAQANEETDGVGEIVVTAQRVESSIQKTRYRSRPTRAKNWLNAALTISRASPGLTVRSTSTSRRASR
jgi:hypothetical protein